MNFGKIIAAEAAAKKFLVLAIDAREELKNEGIASYISGTKISGALRRASLDLTRALAEMRKP